MQPTDNAGARNERAPNQRADEASEIAGITAAMARAWNDGDGDAYAALFTEDCDYIAFDGTHLKGRKANARHHQDLFATVLKGSRMVFEGAPAVRFLAADVALMHAMGSVLLPWQNEVTPKRRSNQTYVIVRQGGHWLVTAFHNTRYRPMRLPTGLALKAIMFFMRLRAGRRQMKRPGSQQTRSSAVRV